MNTTKHSKGILYLSFSNSCKKNEEKETLPYSFSEANSPWYWNQIKTTLKKQIIGNTCILLSHFSHVRLCATPQTAAHQATPSLGFSRQEHWSGLPFPSPMHESEKWKWSHSVVSNPQRHHGLQPSRLLRPWDFSKQEYWSGVPLLSPICIPMADSCWYMAETNTIF